MKSITISMKQFFSNIFTCTRPPKLSLKSRTKHEAPKSWRRFIAAKGWSDLIKRNDRNPNKFKAGSEYIYSMHLMEIEIQKCLVGGGNAF